MLYLYDNSADTFTELFRRAYQDIDEIIEPKTLDEDVYDILFFASLTDIFTIAKRRSAIRSRFAKDNEGKPLVDSFALTDDEKDWFSDIMPEGSAEIWKKLSAFGRDTEDAYRYGVTMGTKPATGTIDIVAGAVLTDSSLTLTPSALIGYVLVITSAGDMEGQQKSIIANTANTITLESAWKQDVTGMDFNVYDSATDYVLYTVKLDSNWDINMLQSCDKNIQEALVSFCLKEWYLINRWMDDFTIEDGHYQKSLAKIKSDLSHGKKPYRRATDFFA